MKHGGIRLLVVLLSFGLLPSLLRADQQADDLDQKYKAALARNEVEQAVSFICDAAKLDPKKYGKKCQSAQQAANKQLQQFDGSFAAGAAALDHKDYSGAIRILSRITFGPHREEAHRMVQTAVEQLAHPALLAESTQALDTAQKAYESGDLAAATKSIEAVKAAELLPRAQQIATNIRIYTQSMEEADAAMQIGKYALAAQKYKFAISIKDNGPGNPAAKLQKIATLLVPADKLTAQTPANTASVAIPTGTKASGQPLADNAQKIQSDLLKAHAAESKKNVDAALAAYDRVLALDPRQPDALAGKQRLADALKQDPQALEDTLRGGIRNFYQSRLQQANDAISLYIGSGGKRSKGAAYFYLGATMIAQSLLLDSQDKAGRDTLQQHATQQFQLAKQEHFQPVEKYVSPRILAAWRQSGSG